MPPRRPPIRAAAGPPRARQGPPPDLPQAAAYLWKRLYVRGVMMTLRDFTDTALEGHGGYSTVWLCRDQHTDTPSYVAVKILVASETEKHSFEISLNGLGKSEGSIKSANGEHACRVYPVLGPTIGGAAEVFDEESDVVGILQNLSREVVEAVAALHSRGICHGDLRPSNILLELEGLDGLDEKDLLLLLGEPETTRVYMREDSRPTPEMPYAPDYLVYPINLKDIDDSVILPHAQIIDFGQSFNITQQPLPTTFGIPVNYAAPEVFFDSAGSVAMDLWSLACTIYEIRLGRRLFDVFQLITPRKQDYCYEIASILWEPPQPWAEFLPTSDSEPDAGTSQTEPVSGLTRNHTAGRKHVAVLYRRKWPAATTVTGKTVPISKFKSSQNRRLQIWQIC